MNQTNRSSVKRAGVVLSILMLIACSLRIVMATPDCSDFNPSCADCAVGVEGGSWSDTTGSIWDGGDYKSGPGPDDVITPITEENTECNKYLAGASAQGLKAIIVCDKDGLCGVDPTGQVGGVEVDVGNTGCESDVVETGCGGWQIRFWNPKHNGTVTITAHVDSDDVAGCGTSGTTNFCSCVVNTKHLRAVGSIPVRVSNSSSPPFGPGGAGGSGCASCGGGSGPHSGVAGTASVEDDSVNFQLNLGAANPRRNAGSLWLYATRPSADLARPVLLGGPVNQPGVEVITSESEVIEQVLTPEMLVNVAVVNDYEYQLQCFYTNNVGAKDGSGFYTTNAAAFTTWIIQNPDRSSDNTNLWITELRDGQSRYFKYSYTASSDRWDLLEPDNQTMISAWNVPDSGDATITNQFHQITFNGTVVQKSQKEYQYVAALLNTVLVQEVDGDGTTTRTTTYTYYSGSNTDGSQNRLRRVDYPEGNWIYYKYDSMGRKVTEYAAYGNNAPPTAGTEPNPLVDHCKNTTYSYSLNTADDGENFAGDPDNPWSICKTVVSIPVNSGGTWSLQEVSRTYNESSYDWGWSDSRQCVKPGASWSDAGNLDTYTESNYGYDWPSGLNGLPVSVTHPDGSVTTYSYTDDTTTENDPDGTQTVTLTDAWGNPLSRTKTDTTTGVVLSKVKYNYQDGSDEYYDPLRRGHDVTDLAGRTTQYRYTDCCGYSTVTDPDGVTTQYDYDVLKRQVASTAFHVAYGSGDGIKTTNVLSSTSQVLQTMRIGTDDSIITNYQAQYDVLGRVVAQTNALGGVTRTSYGVVSGQLYVTNTYPGGGTRIETYYREGRLQSVTGTAVHPIEYLYSADQDSDGTWREYTQEIKLTAAGETNEWTKTCVDGAGRSYKTIYSIASGSNPYSQSYYNEYGQFWKQVDPDGVITMYIFDNSGGLNQGQIQYTITALSSTARAITDYDTLVSSLSVLESGTDRIQKTVKTIVSADDSAGLPYRVRSDVYAWTDGDTGSDGTLISSSEISTNGLSTWQIQYADEHTSVTNRTQTIYSSPSRTITNIAQDGSYTVSAYSHGQLISSTQYDSTATQILGTTFSYDAHGRQYRVTDARNGATTYGYNAADQVTSVATPAPGGGQSAETTATLYDTMLRPYSVTQPDGTTVNSLYLLTGELGLQYGSRTYPVGYSYDYAGRMQTMTNWSSYSGYTDPRVTTWNYDPNRGWLASKVYADGHGPSYTYTSSGRLHTRTWARGVTTTYSYDNAGSLSDISYGDSTHEVVKNYDRLGRLGSIICNSMTDALTYNWAGLLLSESFSGGTLDGLSVTNGYDQFLRRTNLTALASGVLNRTAYYYDVASRLQAVYDSNGCTAYYNYLANSLLVSQIIFTNGGNWRMTKTKQNDYLNRLTQISSQPSALGLPPIAFNYNYNAANQRTKNALADGSYWVYGYDSLGQVTNGCKYFRDGTPVPGQQFGYLFDDTGNRKQTLAGGDAAGAGLRLASYSVNNLNQITARDYPGTNDVIGAALATNAVTLNGQTAWHKGEYFWSTAKTNNASHPQWLGVTVASGGNTNKGSVFIAQTPEQFSYDADGNLTNDGRWAYTWDGENQLTGMTVNTNVGPQYQLTFAYDAKGRRIQKLVATNGVALSTNNFLYDGWNLIAETRPDNSLIRSYVWGTDLSGTSQGAGGVGGLLEISYYGSSTTNCFPAYDGNGNIMALVNAADGTVAANYDYAAFGEPIRITGVMARNNPFRFSTKYADDESDLLYYGYRYYKPSTGAWPNKDPLTEIGFHLLIHGKLPFVNAKSNRYLKLKNWLLNEPGNPNNYDFVANNPISFKDSFGLEIDWQDVIDKMNQIIDSGKDIAKEIQDAIKDGKLHGLTPKDALDQFFGIGQLTDSMVGVLEAFPDTPSCLKMVRAAKNKNQCACADAASECALDLGIATGSASVDNTLEKFFTKKICKQ